MAKEIGKVVHYFDKPQVAVLDLNKNLKLGDFISIKGFTTDFSQIVHSLEIDNNPQCRANKGDDIALKVPERVRKNDKVFLIR